MRYLVVVFVLSFTSLLLLIHPHIAKAEGKGSTVSVPAKASADHVRIIADQNARAFRFMIGVKEVARIDEQGLHVRENVEYGGAITDVGTQGYDKTPTAAEKAPE